ncbi:RNA-binding domain-containing protein [uncultured Acetobacterium sp.]|uniref:AlbA family DNA-binding domain-containing protein n=1 Tax=uncultured Acetobacterium sp. TaxID=217139 RepID=UPI0025FC5978|nr:RNA-binding domain-containing protein [uncultured Acetobacterium sp.]
MKPEKLSEIISGGEGLTIEFKQSRTKLNRDVFETVCAFLNRNGGHLFLGVDDQGGIVGIEPDAIEKLRMDFVTAMNNPLKICPTFYLTIEAIEMEGKTIFHILVPESSQVHRCNDRIFDRNEDGDLDITDNTNLVAGLYNRKQWSYTENRIFPYAELSELNPDLLIRARKMAANERSDHPWKTMNDLELLKSAGLYLKDPQSDKEGITLAGILIFGKPELILAALPHHRTDALLRKVKCIVIAYDYSVIGWRLAQFIF